MARPVMTDPSAISKEFTVDPGAVASVTCLDVTVSIAGLRKNFPVIVWAPSLEANLAICNAHCPSAGNLKFRLCNPTAGSIDPASQLMEVVQF